MPLSVSIIFVAIIYSSTIQVELVCINFNLNILN